MSHYLDTLLDATQRLHCARNAAAMAGGQAAWDAACPPEREDEDESNEEALRDAFAEAVQGDLNATALWAFGLPWFKRSNANVADVLADALGDDQKLLRRAMAVLVNAAAGRGTQREAQQLIEQAGAGWARRNA